MAAWVRAALAAAAVVLSSAAAFADDWVAVRLRGAVLQLVDGEWQKLSRGDVVPDSRVIRTLAMGSVEFQRGEERVGLGPDTQIQIYDRARSKPFTTVKQYFGTVTVEAEVQEVQHFAVQNNYLAAVVKGTRFTVTADADSASVAVARGAVFVEDRATGNDVTVTVGQTASVDGTHGAPTVTGKGVTGNGEGPNVLGGLAKGKPDSPPGKPDNPGKGKGDDNSGKGKSDNDNSGKGKSEEDNSSNGKSGDKSNSGKSGDNSGKGKSDDDKGNDKSNGKGKSDDD